MTTPAPRGYAAIATNPARARRGDLSARGAIPARATTGVRKIAVVLRPTAATPPSATGTIRARDGRSTYRSAWTRSSGTTTQSRITLPCHSRVTNRLPGVPYDPVPSNRRNTIATDSTTATCRTRHVRSRRHIASTDRAVAMGGTTMYSTEAAWTPRSRATVPTSASYDAIGGQLAIG